MHRALLLLSFVTFAGAASAAGAGAASAAGAGAAAAEGAGAVAAEGGITVEHAWSRPAAVGQVGVVYFTVTDSGAPDTLTAVATPIAKDAMLHVSSMHGGMSEMRMLDSVPVSPDKPARLSPGGMHVMLMGLKKKLSLGDTFPITLTFAHAGQITTTVTVQRTGTD